MGLIFEWDDNKAKSNLSKHEVSFEEATTIYSDPLSLTISDPQHSINEKRYIIIGRSINDNILVVIFTERGDNIRIISSRKANKRERKQYEE